ncbi:hypothetical protein EPUS_02145 [Endocarpon pusillum Z07020]|uniref:Uncharacterized protein n=1 Tax=Endocarpon pusillum (strain Z07020 / HMAS-L-300199) TaxID=1263415 RepID=U1GJD7_ENDPU|nr:uncharacterized protein EPUS_02145 [Endocarpon pusillum Z07020]ERF72258.1 hypothetical protein EPUS_02145 [Endocarpon pusillum Z07020]
MGGKKSVDKADSVMQYDGKARRDQNNLPAEQAETAIGDSCAHPVLTATGRVVKHRTDLQCEGRPSRRSAARDDSKASEAGDATNTSYDSKNNDQDDVIESPKARKRRTRKKEQPVPEETLDSLRSEREYFKGLYEQEKAKAKDLKIKRAAINKENISRRKNQTTLKQKVKSWQAETQNEQKFVAELQKKLADKDQIIAKSSEAVFRHIGKGASDTLDDNHVRGRLKEVRMMRQNWVSEHAISSLNGVPEQFIKRLLEYGMPKAVSLLEKQSTYQLFIREQGAPRMLLGILVSHSCRQLLEDPFASLERVGHAEKMGLQRVLDHGMPRNERMTRAWRQLTAKVLNLGDDSVVGNANEGEDGLESLARVRGVYYERLAEDIRGDAYYLLKGLDENRSRIRFEDLLHLIRTTGALCAELWAQEAQMRLSSQDFEMETVFSSDSQLLRPHSCMCLDAMDRRYDGRKVMLVVEPGLYASSNEDDKDYGEWRPWIPAIIWLSEQDPKRIQSSTAAPTEDADDTITEAKRRLSAVNSQLQRPSKRSKHEHAHFPNETESERQDGLPSSQRVEAVDRLVASKGPVEDAKMEASSSNSPPNGSLSLSQANQYPVASLSAEGDPIPPPEEGHIFGKELIAHAISGSSERQDGQSKILQDFRRAGFPKEDKNRVMEQEEGGGMPADRSSEVAASYDKLQHIEAGTFESYAFLPIPETSLSSDLHVLVLRIPFTRHPPIHTIRRSYLGPRNTQASLQPYMINAAVFFFFLAALNPDYDCISMLDAFLEALGSQIEALQEIFQCIKSLFRDS